MSKSEDLSLYSLKLVAQDKSYASSTEWSFSKCLNILLWAFLKH